MGFFNGYLREGPGVNKNARRKRGFFLYIDILSRKFFNILKANVLYFLFSIPFIVLIFLILAPYVMNALGINAEWINSIAEKSVNASMGAGVEIADPAADIERISAMFYFTGCAFITMLIFNFIGSGPISAVYAYATRCFIRGEHTWILSDGKDKIKENFKPSILLFLLDLVVIFFGFNALYLYSALPQAGAMGYIGSLVIMIILFVYAAMHIFVYQIMVTYECKFKDLIKNSIMMAIAKLPMCIVLSAISLLIISLIACIPNFILMLAVYGIIGITFTRFSFEFYAARVIEKNIKAVKKTEKKREAKITYLDEE